MNDSPIKDSHRIVVQRGSDTMDVVPVHIIDTHQDNDAEATAGDEDSPRLMKRLERNEHYRNKSERNLAPNKKKTSKLSHLPEI